MLVHILKFYLKVADGKIVNSTNKINNTNSITIINGSILDTFSLVSAKTCACIYLADAFFQSDLHCIQGKRYISTRNPWEFNPWPFSVASIMLHSFQYLRDEWMHESVRKDQPNDKVLSSKVQMNVEMSVCVSTSGDAGPGTAPGFSFRH